MAPLVFYLFLGLVILQGPKKTTKTFQSFHKTRSKPLKIDQNWDMIFSSHKLQQLRRTALHPPPVWSYHQKLDRSWSCRILPSVPRRFCSGDRSECPRQPPPSLCPWLAWVLEVGPPTKNGWWFLAGEEVEIQDCCNNNNNNNLPCEKSPTPRQLFSNLRFKCRNASRPSKFRSSICLHIDVDYTCSSEWVCKTHSQFLDVPTQNLIFHSTSSTRCKISAPPPSMQHLM